MRRFLSLLSVGTLLFLVYIPLFAVIFLSFNLSTLSSEWKGFTLQWYQAAAADYGLKAAVRNSIFVASGATALSLLLGTTAAFAVQSAAGSIMKLVDATLRVPLLFADVAMAVALGMFFWSFEFGGSLASIVFAHSGWGLSIIYLIVRSNLVSIPLGLGLAAADCGADSWQTNRHIYLPLAVPSIVGGGLLVFALSLGDFTYSLFCAGPGSTTLPVFLYSALRFRFTPAVYSVFTVLLVSTLCMFAVSAALLRTTLFRFTTTQADSP